MKFNTLVKHNGVYYPVGTEVPIGETTVENNPTETKEIETVEVVNEHKYSKSEIQLMKVDDLRELAKSIGMENVEETSGTNLKKALIEYYNL